MDVLSVCRKGIIKNLPSACEIPLSSARQNSSEVLPCGAQGEGQKVLSTSTLIVMKGKSTKSQGHRRFHIPERMERRWTFVLALVCPRTSLKFPKMLSAARTAQGRRDPARKDLNKKKGGELLVDSTHPSFSLRGKPGKKVSIPLEPNSRHS